MAAPKGPSAGGTNGGGGIGSELASWAGHSSRPAHRVCIRGGKGAGRCSGPAQVVMGAVRRAAGESGQGRWQACNPGLPHG